MRAYAGHKPAFEYVWYRFFVHMYTFLVPAVRTGRAGANSSAGAEGDWEGVLCGTACAMARGCFPSFAVNLTDLIETGSKCQPPDRRRRAAPQPRGGGFPEKGTRETLGAGNVRAPIS